MSATELFYFDENGNACCLGEIRNAFRGAMAVWKILEEKYLPPYKPAWGTNSDNHSRVAMMFDSNAMKDIWDLFKRSDVTTDDKIVLGSTFDQVTVLAADIPRLISAFKEFDECYPSKSNIGEQASMLEELLKGKEGFTGVAWNQTSVNNAWVFDYDEDGEIPYNILTGEKHWDLFEDLA